MNAKVKVMLAPQSGSPRLQSSLVTALGLTSSSLPSLILSVAEILGGSGTRGTGLYWDTRAALSAPGEGWPASLSRAAAAGLPGRGLRLVCTPLHESTLATSLAPCH